MSELKNPFGLRNGKIIMIAELQESERGVNCDCVCPYCKGKFLARLGKSRQHHFAHDGKPCDEVAAVLTAAYSLMQEAIQEKAEFHYPSCYGVYSRIPPDFLVTRERILQKITWTSYQPSISDSSQFECKQVIRDKTVPVIHSEIRKTAKGVPKALILTHESGHKLALILVPPETLCKTPIPRPFENLPTIAIYLPKKLYLVTSELLRKNLRNGIEQKEWISSPKKEKWVDLLLEQHNKEHQDWLDQEPIRLKRQREEYERQIAKEEKRAAERAERQKQEETRKVNQIHAYTEEEREGYNREFSSRHLEDSTEQVCDSLGHRWCFCETCKRWYPEEEMSYYGGDGTERNRGKCRFCSRRKSNP